MGELLGLAVACAFGSADFLGAFATRRSPVVTILFVQQLSGLLLALGVVLLAEPHLPPARDAALAAGAGTGSMLGLAYLYRGLALGRMTVVAPLSAAGSAVLEVIWGLGRGERPGMPVMVGGALLLAAVGVIAGGRKDDADHSEVGAAREAMFAGGAAFGFAASFVLMAETSSRSGYWPVVVARAAAVVLLAAALTAGRRPFRPRAGAVPLVVAAGFLDAGANMALLAAVRSEMLTVVAPLAALYPAATVLLARVVLHERVTRRRATGLLVALAGLAFIAAR